MWCPKLHRQMNHVNEFLFLETWWDYLGEGVIKVIIVWRHIMLKQTEWIKFIQLLNFKLMCFFVLFFLVRHQNHHEPHPMSVNYWQFLHVAELIRESINEEQTYGWPSSNIEQTPYICRTFRFMKYFSFNLITLQCRHSLIYQLSSFLFFYLWWSFCSLVCRMVCL